MMTLVYGIVRTDAVGWASTSTVATLAAAAVLLNAFVLVEKTTRNEPLVRLGHRSVTGATFFNLLLGGATSPPPPPPPARLSLPPLPAPPPPTSWGAEIVTGVGFGLALAPVVSVATAGVAADESGTASALLNSSRQIGAALGLAALGTLAASRTGGDPFVDAANAGYGLGLTRPQHCSSSRFSSH